MANEAHLATTHEQYPDGFPARLNDDLLGHWPTPSGTVVVEQHPHGYEVHVYPCMTCDACAADRGPANPHTGDGHHFRLCAARGPVMTIAGGEEGYRAVLEYLAIYGSSRHAAEFDALRAADAAREQERVDREAAEDEETAAELAQHAPTVAERFAALEAEFAALRETMTSGGNDG